MDSTEFIDDILAHHGVKGQKWGVRRSFTGFKAKNARLKAEQRKPQPVIVTTKQGLSGKTKIQTTGGQNRPAHPEAIKARVTQQKIKKSGVTTLSNEELQAYANRMDLELRVSRVSSQNASVGRIFVQKQLSNKGNQKLIQDQGAKAVAKLLAKKGAKVAAVAAA